MSRNLGAVFARVLSDVIFHTHIIFHTHTKKKGGVCDMTAYYLFSHCVGLTLPPWSRDFPEPHLVRKKKDFVSLMYFYLFLI